MLIQFDLPQNLDGAVLMAELAAVGIIVNDQTSPAIDGAGNFWLDIDPTKDLIPVCPNCHAMLHRTKPSMKPDELEKIIGLKK